MSYCKCHNCGNEVSDTVAGNDYLNNGKFYCFDCIMDLANKTKAGERQT